MANKIFRSTVVVVVLVLLCSLGTVLGVLYNHFTEVQVQQLKDELSLAVTGTEQHGNGFLENVEADRFRITWVAVDGTVLFDTKATTAEMENHADREEIREALKTGFGSATRYSDTLTERTFYEAARLSDGTVLRISASQTSAAMLMLSMLWPILLIALVAIVLSMVLARQVAKKTVEPLNTLDLEHPLQNPVYEEITPLLRRINQQHNQIHDHIQTLRQRADEFDQITANMKEGLVLLNSECTILSINPTAAAIFGAEDSCVGKHFWAIDNSPKLRSAINGALDRGYGVAKAQYNGRNYQFDLSRIESDSQVIGAVLLAFDITETLNAEQTRREFSANVSHELKTPLQSIIGSAEMLEAGMVKSEDVPRFVGHIRKEAARLVSLIEDIIRLSQLDEGVEIPRENVDLYTLAEEVVSALDAVARDKAVSVEIAGEGCQVNGVRRLLYEILYNLCENAIKYNVPGGSVTVTLEPGVLKVSDTGVGIPPEHQSRVFERFYRVDKSHSKQSGGTGLGLSIVKHAALYHGAKLELQSTPGKGTTITVTF